MPYKQFLVRSLATYEWIAAIQRDFDGVRYASSSAGNGIERIEAYPITDLEDPQEYHHEP